MSTNIWNWQEWGTTPQKAYLRYAAAINSGDYTKVNGQIVPKSTAATMSNGSSLVSSSSSMPTLVLPTYKSTATYTAPEYEDPEAYVAPEYDESKVASLTQKKSAAGLRAARQALQQTIGGYYENPNVKRMTLRDALAGYGQSVESVISGADTSARDEYNTEYGIKSDQAKTNYNTDIQTSKIKHEGDVNAAQLNYQSALDAEKTNYNAQVAAFTSQYQAHLADYMAKIYGTNATKYGTATSGQGDSSGAVRIGTTYANYNTPTYDRDGKLIST